MDETMEDDIPGDYTVLIIADRRDIADQFYRQNVCGLSVRGYGNDNIVSVKVATIPDEVYGLIVDEVYVITDGHDFHKLNPIVLEAQLRGRTAKGPRIEYVGFETRIANIWTELKKMLFSIK